MNLRSDEKGRPYFETISEKMKSIAKQFYDRSMLKLFWKYKEGTELNDPELSALEAYLSKEEARRLDALVAYYKIIETYGVPEEGSEKYFFLSVHLAKDFVKNFDIMGVAHAGTNKTKKFPTGLRLYDAVNELTMKSMTIIEACKILVKTKDSPWWGANPQTLSVRFSEAKNRMERWEAIKADNQLDIEIHS